MTTPENAPWRQLRDLEPPLGSKRRVIQQAQEQVLTPPASTKGPWFITASVVAFAAFGLWLSFGRSESAVEVASEVGEDAGQRLPPSADTLSQAVVPELSVAQDDELVIRLPKAKLEVIGPAEVNVTDTGIRIHVGRVQIAGEAFVTTHRCGVQVSGNAVATVVDDELQVRVTRGHAKSSHPACIVLYTDELHVREGSELAATEVPGQLEAAVTETVIEEGNKLALAKSPPAEMQPVRSKKQKADILAMAQEEADKPTGGAGNASGRGIKAGEFTKGAVASAKPVGETSESDRTAKGAIGSGNATGRGTKAGGAIDSDRTATGAIGSGNATGRGTKTGEFAGASDSDKPAIGTIGPDKPAGAAGSDKTTSAGSKASSLRQQVESYKYARTRLKSQPSEGLRLLQNFVKTWPSSLLREDAEALGIETLFQLNRSKEARKKLRAFATRHPSSTHIKKLSDLAGEVQ